VTENRNRRRQAVRALRLALANPATFVRGLMRLPLEQQAARRIANLPQIQLADLALGRREVCVNLPSPASRHGWSLGEAEQLCLQVLIRSRGLRTAFEIGTFNGGTTRLIAEALPDDGHIHTLDLPPASFDATQRPTGFTGTSIGTAYRGSPAEGRITQLFGDSLSFDFEPYERTADLVLVDAGHEYENGLSDSRAALRLVRPGGIVIWDDFEPYWHGLVNGICDAMAGRPIGRLAGTALAVHCAVARSANGEYPEVRLT
jgi:predicted O-methyltransferase YrrM